MANGMEQDVREIRVKVDRVERDGCGHKMAHDDSISNLWDAVGDIKKGQVELMRNIVMSVFGVVLALMIANFFVTKQTIATMVKENESTAASVATENKKLLQEMMVEIKSKK